MAAPLEAGAGSSLRCSCSRRRRASSCVAASRRVMSASCFAAWASADSCEPVVVAAVLERSASAGVDEELPPQPDTATTKVAISDSNDAVVLRR